MTGGARPFLVIGHRGARARAPENTAASLRCGLDAGAGAIEIDVGLSHDGRAILLHDATLDRTTSGRGPLGRLSWEEVEQLDAGSWFAPRFAGERPLDLDRALALVRARLPLIVEIKARAPRDARRPHAADRRLVRVILDAFERTGGLAGVTISSACWVILGEARTLAPGVDLALTVGWSEGRDPLEWAGRIGASALHPNFRLCDRRWTARARGAGFAVLPYTVNRASELDPLVAAGVDGVFTDDPAALRRLLERRGAGPAAVSKGEALFLGIDQGSGGTRAAVADRAGRVVASRAVPVGSRTGVQGAIVMDAETLAASVVRAAAPLLEAHGRSIAAAGIATQRSSLVVWRRADGRPVTPVLSWRAGAVPIPQALASREREVARSTGLTARYPYGAIRIAALASEDVALARGLGEGSLCAGPVGSFLASRLTAGHPATIDPSLAQRLLLLDAGTRDWSPEMLALTGVPRAGLPEIAPSTAARGVLRLGTRRVPLLALSGDVGAAARAALDGRPAAEGLLVLGTGGFFLVPSGALPDPVDGLLRSILWDDGRAARFAIEGTVHGVAANLLEAARRGGLSDTDPLLIAAAGATSRRVPAVVPAIEGLGTPDWEPAPRFETEAGRFTAEALARGTVEGLAERFARIASLLRGAGRLPAAARATGGLAFSPHLVHAIAARCGFSISIDPRAETTAIGAALLAGDARGH